MNILRLGPVSRISMGLVSLAAFLLLTADLVLGLMPDAADVAKQVRKRTSEALAVQLTALVQTDQIDALRRTLHAVISRDDEVLSIAVRRANGEILAETGNHARHWIAPANNKSTITSVVVPISSGKDVWGQVEIAYRPPTPQTLIGWLRYPGVALTLLMLTVGFGVFYLYLRRILQRLDPKAAIPDRIRTAFDALSEGVLVVDKQGHVLLANSVFRSMHPGANIELTGKRIKDLPWLVAAVGEDAEQHPWARAMRDAASILGETIHIPIEGGDPLKLTVNCAPIMDDGNTVRGCLVTFDDLSVVEHMNQALLDSVAQLEVAKKQIEEHNAELKRIADVDQLTGALTRRAFLNQAQQQFRESAAHRRDVCCVMIDIDHFKSINDRYGHLVGDQAIQHVTKTIQAELCPRHPVSLRRRGILCPASGGDGREGLCLGGAHTHADRGQVWPERDPRRQRAHHLQLWGRFSGVRREHAGRNHQAGRPGLVCGQEHGAQPHRTLRSGHQCQGNGASRRLSRVFTCCRAPRGLISPIETRLRTFALPSSQQRA